MFDNYLIDYLKYNFLNCGAMDGVKNGIYKKDVTSSMTTDRNN